MLPSKGRSGKERRRRQKILHISVSVRTTTATTKILIVTLKRNVGNNI
jgi:hypothetical protein